MRTVGSNGEVTERALREAGIRLIAQHGYEAVSLRMLAREVGVQAGSLYNYMHSKQDFLFRLLVDIIEDLFVELSERIHGVEDPLLRLRIFIAVHIEFHTRRKNEVFIGNMELRSLTPEHYETVVGMRKRYEHLLRDIIRDGQSRGHFSVSDDQVATYAVLAMLTGVSDWYKPAGKLSIRRLTEIYVEMTLRSLGVSADLLPRREAS